MTNSEDPDHASFLLVRYHQPDMIREIRAGFDLGAHAKTFERKFKKAMKKAADDPDAQKAGKLALAALRYMVRNPLAGRVRWTEGEQYVWSEDETAENTAQAS